MLLGRWGLSFSYLKRPTQADHKAVHDILQQVGLSERSRIDCRELSGGQWQRLNIARALVRNPDILLLDEPTTYLDVESRQLMFDLIGQLRHNSPQLSILMITHEAADVEQMADRSIQLHQGQLVENGVYR
ncbi:Arginine transport ATP-binding protein ArtM [compost metagenome]